MYMFKGIVLFLTEVCRLWQDMEGVVPDKTSLYRNLTAGTWRSLVGGNLSF